MAGVAPTAASLGLPDTWEASPARCCWCQAPLIRVRGTKHPWWCGGTERCKARQAAWMIQIGGRIVFLPTPRQVEFLESRGVYTLYGGSAGPGKSHAARWGLYSWCLRVPNLRTLILRETSGELLRSHITGLMDIEVEQTLGGRFAANPMPLARFPNGSFIEGGHMEDAAAVKKYLSSEYDIIVAEEATQYQPDTLLELITRARSSNDALNALGGARSWLPTNPGGPSTDILRMLFMDRDLETIAEDWPHLEYVPTEWVYVPALLDDNPYLDPRYEKQLGILRHGWRYRQLRHGDWYALPGVFFDQFAPATHVQRIDLPEPSRLSWFRSLDWGYHDPSVCLWWVVLDDGHLHIAREAKWTALTPIEAARQHVLPGDDALGLPRPRTQIPTYASPDMWPRRGQTGETPQETSRRIGWPLRPANNRRANGWMRIHALLRDAPDGTPWLTIDPSCKYLIRSLQTAVHDKTDVNDVAQHDDHALECFTAGTPVLTDRGWVPIEQVTLQDRAWTRAGWRPVEAVFSVGVRLTLRIALSNGETMQVTPTHPIWADGDFRPARDLRYGHLLWPCSAGQPTISAPVHCGSGRMARFRRAITSIIATAIGPTTRSTIWNACPRAIISIGMRSSAFQRRSPVRRVGAWLRRGLTHIGSVPTPARLVGDGGSAWMTGCAPVPWVVGHSHPIATTARPSALGPALVLGPTSGHTSMPPAVTAECSSALETAAPSGAPLAVVSVHTGSPQTVYNLTVSDHHEYFAHGMLVGNCCRYGAMSRPAPKSHGPIDRPRGAFDDDFTPRRPPVVGASTAWR